VSSGFFDDVIEKCIDLVNEEFEKLLLKKITRDDLLMFFNDESVGIEIFVPTTETRVDILNMRMIKISMEIQEIYNLPGFCILVSHQ